MNELSELCEHGVDRSFCEIHKLRAEVETSRRNHQFTMGTLEVVKDELKSANLQKGRLLKAANDLLGKIGGPKTPIDPAWEDEFVELDILVGEMRITNNTCNCRVPEGEGHNRDCPMSKDDGIPNCTCQNGWNPACPVHELN